MAFSSVELLDDQGGAIGIALASACRKRVDPSGTDNATSKPPGGGYGIASRGATGVSPSAREERLFQEQTRSGTSAC